jgi:DNA-binding winged helix-turn-helix (wHTH) protein/tetratricopeptide (TPR) repeat protein/TolB-like protein
MVMRAAESPFRTKGFGVFEVDLRAAELRKHGVRIKLQEQPFQILSLLLEHPGEVVTREELREKLWPAHTFVDFDRSLNKAMTKLRAALGDSADNPRYVETIPRHGYRFLAPVYQPQLEHRQQHAAGNKSPGQLFAGNGKSAAHGTRHDPRPFLDLHTAAGKRRLYGLLATMALAVVGMVIYLRVFPPVALSGSSAVVSPRHSVAVLGFTNLSGDPREAWLSTAFSDWLTTELTAGEQVRAIPAESIARMKMELSMPDVDSLGLESLIRIRKNLGTDYVVVGSYAMLGGKPDGQIRLDLRLQDTQTGETIGAISEAGTEGHLLDLVSRAGQHLREKLGVRAVTREEAAEVAIALPTKSETAKLYSEGLAKLRAFDALRARDLFQKAIAVEPNYALSHAALATAWGQLGYDENAKAEAKKAFDLSSNLSRAERLLVEARYHEASRDWEKAAEIYRALFEFFPDNLEYGLALANAEYKANKWKDALGTVAALQALPVPLRDDPRIELAEGDAAMPLGDTKRAEAAYVSAEQKARASGASLLMAKDTFAYAWLLEKLGRLDQAEQAVHTARDLYLAAHDQKGVADAETGEAIALMFRGDYLSARERYQEALAIHQSIGNMHSVAAEFHNLSEIALYLGEVRGALEKSQQALQIYQEVRDDNGMALAKRGLGDALFVEGKIFEARKMYEESLDTCRQNGHRDREAEAMMGLGEVLRAQGDSHAAWDSEMRAKEVFQEIGDKTPEARAELHLAQLLVDRGDYGEAVKSIQRAEDLLSKTTSPRDDATARILRAQTLLASGKISEARASVSHALEFAERSRDLDILLMARLTAARIDATAGNPTQRQQAAKQLNAVVQQAKAAQFVYAALEARLALGEMELKSTNPAAGRRHLEVLQEDASSQGFLLMVQEAGMILGKSENQAALRTQN